MKHRFLLTFDVEDFINEESTNALLIVLKLLEKHDLLGLFFITGYEAEKLRNSPNILSLLDKHEIGYHSSAHSVHPTIFEYSDVENYEDAIAISIKRETSHINPISGKIEGEGGIRALRSLFPSKKICSYRAPGFCCPPPHLEALASLGIEYDFSWNLSENPVSYKGITFYPKPAFQSCEATFLMGKNEVAVQTKLWFSVLTKTTTILNFHPSVFANEDLWDSIYHAGNPTILVESTKRDSEQKRMMFAKLDSLLKKIRYLEKLKIISACPLLSISKDGIDATGIKLHNAEEWLTYWPRTFFCYEPKFFESHLSRFFMAYRTHFQKGTNCRDRKAHICL